MCGDSEEFATTVDAIVYLPGDVLRADCTRQEGWGRAVSTGLKKRESVFVGELGVQEMVLPLTGDLEIALSQAFAPEAGLFGNADAGGVSRDDICLYAMQPETSRWRSEGKVE